MTRVLTLALFSLIVLSVGCGETQSESESETRSVSTPEEALIGQWNSSEEDITMFISSDGDYLTLYPSGNLAKHKLTVMTQNLQKRTIVLELKSKNNGSGTHKIEFSEDFENYQLTPLNGTDNTPQRYVYVDSKEKP